MRQNQILLNGFIAPLLSAVPNCSLSDKHRHNAGNNLLQGMITKVSVVKLHQVCCIHSMTPCILYHPSKLLQQILALKYLINHIPGHTEPQFHATKTLRRAISCVFIISATVMPQETQRKHPGTQQGCSQPALLPVLSQ